MKSKFYIIASILAVICMLCSCGGGGGSADGEAQKVVAVSFDINTGDSAKVITVYNPDVMSLGVTYQYMAIPSFTSEFGGTNKDNPQGTQRTWKDLNMNGFTSTDELYFAQGHWTFHVRVIIKGTDYNVDNDSTYTLLYQTATAGESKYINAANVDSTSHKVVVVANVTRQIDDGADGYLFVNGINAPDTSGADKLVVSYGAIGDAQTTLVTITNPTISGGRSTFTKNQIPVAPGIYAMTFTLKDSSDNEVGASTKIVEILKNNTTTLSGAMDANKWISAGFNVKGIKTIEATISTSTITVTQGTPVVFGITGTIKESGVATTDPVTFYFYPGNGIAGFAITLENGNYSWATGSVPFGNYTVSLIATDAAGTLAISPISLNITVTP